ncbi:MAG: hypothetical protein Q8922_15430 [Bacteroidota bacterium]|nr:hypothetical protein [Bacteroidota bacterium]MDP4234784.1 hypothetical protein [Bacteroidota bacterium]MDP4244136.1 hypothetical protein [Bacteroidota bacterium]MDP4289308.1 hypothetical protein [Bacteroidota bacterium]
MKHCLPLLVLLVTASLFGSPPAIAQGSLHTPLKGIEVRLQSIAAKGITDTLRASSSLISSFKLECTTDEDGNFMFGYVPPGAYALGCSYASCYTAFRNTKHPAIEQTQLEGDTASSGEPLMQISINACEGMVCRIAVKKMRPDEWLSNPQPSATTTITKDWSNGPAWLNSGGGLTLQVDGANSIVSGKIVAR